MVSNSPVLPKGGIVLLDAASGTVLRIIPLQYNPESVSRSFQLQAIGTDSADRSEAFRLKGPSIETIKVDVELMQLISSNWSTPLLPRLDCRRI